MSVKAFRIRPEWRWPLIAAALGIVMGIGGARAKYRDGGRPEWWGQLGAEERVELKNQAAAYLRLPTEQREQLRQIYDLAESSDLEPQRVREAVVGFDEWRQSLGDRQRAELDQLLQSNAVGPALDMFLSDATGSPEPDDPTPSEVPPHRQMTPEELESIFTAISHTTELSAREREQWERLEGADRAWFVMAIALRKASYSRLQQMPKWPSTSLAVDIIAWMPASEFRSYLENQTVPRAALTLARFVSSQLERDLPRLIGKVGFRRGDLPMLRAGGRALNDGDEGFRRRQAIDGRLRNLANQLGVTMPDLMRTIRWVVSTSNRNSAPRP